MADYAAEVSRLIECLEHARTRPAMYFGEVAVEPAVHFLNGLQFAETFWLGNLLETRLAVASERGWPRTAMHPSQHMVERGFTPAEVIDELLIIEIETLRMVAPG